MSHMTKRILAAMLWFYAGWYAGAMLADMLGVSPFLGPIIGAAVAGLIVGDPRRLIWTSRATNATASTAATESLSEAAWQRPARPARRVHIEIDRTPGTRRCPGFVMSRGVPPARR